ncbi:MAG: hypothetical protein AB1772_12810 [Candidatus Zixiibacteriota bacterium]
MRQPILTLLIAALALVGTAQGEDNPSNDERAVSGPWEEYSLEAALTELEIDYGLWLEMELAGVHPEVERLEKAMLSLLSYDIYVAQERVRELAEIEAETGDPHPGKPEAAEDQLELETEFYAALEGLNVRETLYRSLRRTKAFSNKYRLLGDYINLLRRELELPRLKLANEKVTHGRAGAPGSQAPPDR